MRHIDCGYFKYQTCRNSWTSETKSNNPLLDSLFCAFSFDLNIYQTHPPPSLPHPHPQEMKNG